MTTATAFMLSSLHSPSHMIMAENSWGILATQNALVDECLACEEGNGTLKPEA